MSVFGNYSRYYDLLYRNKKYAEEADFVRSLIERNRPGAATLLDLGCGTGRHAHLLAKHGYRVTGVDRSEQMLSVARAQPAAPGASVDFAQGDIRSLRLGRTFDAVVSLFHVISYQTSNADLAAAFATLRAHLAPGGLFVFDCWYGPAVLTTRPEVRVLRLEDEAIRVMRVAEPVMYPNRNVADINYQVLVTDKQSGAVDELRETHSMRYLFTPEVELMLAGAGLELQGSCEFMTEREPGFDSWTAVFTGRARG